MGIGSSDDALAMFAEKDIIRGLPDFPDVADDEAALRHGRHARHVV